MSGQYVRCGGGSNRLFYCYSTYVQGLWYILSHAVIAGDDPGADRDWGQ